MGNLKRIICIISVFIMTAGMLAGCGLIDRDVRAYNNLPVATVGGITITKKQLVDGFNNFGYQYEQDYQYSREKALEETLTLLIDREIMVNLALEQFYNKTEEQITAARNNNDDFPYNFLSENEKSAARKTAFDSLNSSYKQIEDEIRASYNLNAATTGGEEETSSNKTHDIYNPYTPMLTKHNVERDKETNLPVMVSDNKYSSTVYRIDVAKFVEESKVSNIADNWTPNTRVSNPTGVEKKIADEALGSMVRRLKTNETGLTFEEDKEKSGKDKSALEINQNIIAREVKRIYTEESKNIVIRKFRDLFDQGLSQPIDRENGIYGGVSYSDLVKSFGEQEAYEFAVSASNSNYTDNLVKRAEEYYKRQVRNQIDKYKKQQETDASIGTNLLDDLANVYYAPESIINQYFSVSHILIGYSDEQKADLERIEAKKKTSGNLTDYETSLNALRARTGGYMRNEKGEEIGKFMTATEILEYIQGYVMPYDKTQDAAYNSKAVGNGYVRDVEEIRVAFRDCIYMFNTDPGMVNPEFEYVIGVTESRMVEEFNEAARDLYWNFDTDKQEGKPGGMSGLVWSQFGAHIIMYTRNINEFVYHNSAALLDTPSVVNRFLFATQTSYGNKTTFDKIVDTLTKPEYDAHEKELVAGFLEGKTITTIKRNFKDLY